MIIKRLIVTEISQKKKKPFGRYLFWNLHIKKKQEEKNQKKLMTHGNVEDLYNLFIAIFWDLIDVEDYFFSCGPESILSFLSSFFPVLTVWDESPRKHQA